MMELRPISGRAVELDPAVRELDEGVRFPLCQPDALATAFRNANLTAIQVVPFDIRTQFKDFDDYWSPFLGGQGPAPSYVMSLDGTARDRLRDRIRGRRNSQSADRTVVTAWRSGARCHEDGTSGCALHRTALRDFNSRVGNPTGKPDRLPCILSVRRNIDDDANAESDDCWGFADAGTAMRTQ